MTSPSGLPRKMIYPGSRPKGGKLRSKKFLDRVRGEPCLICGSPPRNHAHHLRHSEKSGMGQKVSDKWTVPLCWKCHASCHTRGREDAWWIEQGIDPIKWSENFFKEWKNG